MGSPGLARSLHLVVESVVVTEVNMATGGPGGQFVEYLSDCNNN